MLDSGVGVRKALGVAIRSSRGRMRKALVTVDAAIGNGKTVTEGMCAARIFSHDDISIIEAGEMSGRLNQSFMSLSVWHMWKARTWNAVRSGLTTPCLQLHVAAFIVPISFLILGQITLIGYLVSVFSFLFVSMYIPLGILLGIYWVSGTQGRARRLCDRILLKVPLLGTALYDIALARYCGCFLALFEAGVPMSICAEISHNICGNAEVASMLAGGANSVRAGNAVSEGFSKKLPEDFLAMWHMGEQTGRLSESLQFISAQRQEEAENNLREFGRWVPRICMFIVMLLLAWLILKMRGC